jgi:hypothetical protein
MPKKGESVTQGQIDADINIDKFDGAKPDPDKKWHQGVDGGGLFEAWSLKFGYEDGFPLYGGALVGGKKVHIYYLPKTDQTILLKAGETPDNYKS